MYTYEKKRRRYWQFRTCTLCAKTIYLFLFIQHVFVKKEIINNKKRTGVTQIKFSRAVNIIK